MSKNPKFLMMIATVGLAFSMTVHAENDFNQNYNQTPNASIESAKDFIGKTFNFGKNAINSITNSEPIQEVKGAVNSTTSAIYNSNEAQKVKGVVNDVYQSKPVQEVRGAITSTTSAIYNSNEAQKVKGVVNDVYQSKPVQEVRGAITSTTSSIYGSDEKKPTHAEPNKQAVSSFFGNLLNKTKEATNEITSTIQKEITPEDPIGDFARSEKVKQTVVSSPEEAIKNAQNIRGKTQNHSSKNKFQH